MFVCTCLTSLVGLNYLIIATIIGNFINYDVSKYLEWKEAAIALGIFGLSLYLSCG